MEKSAAEILRELGELGSDSGLELLTAKNGLLTAKKNGRLVDSGHDPIAGAKKRLIDLNPDGKLRALVFGDGFGYLARVLRDQGLPVVLYETEKDILGLGYHSLGHEAWQGFRLEILDQELSPGLWEQSLPPDLLIDELLIIPPSGRNLVLENSLTNLLLCLKRRAIDHHTTRWFGGRWVLNVFDNLLDLSKSQGPVLAPSSLPLGGDWVIAVPGPSLEDNYRFLIKERKNFSLLALAPALPFLLSVGLIPDVVCSSDGGWANRYHLAGLAGLERVPLVFPLTLARGILRDWSGPLLPVIGGLSIESLVSPSLVRMGETPSVALFALRLALAAQAGRVIMVGQDFSSRSSQGHVRGYRFDEDLVFKADRVNPVEGGLATTWKRRDPATDGWRIDSKLRLYLDGFLEFITPFKTKLFRLGGSPFLASLPEVRSGFKPGEPQSLRFANLTLNRPLLSRWEAGLASLSETEGAGLILRPELEPLIEIGLARVLRASRQAREIKLQKNEILWLNQVKLRLGNLLNSQLGDADTIVV